MLWPDTFNNYFLPDTAKAAVEVLEAAGFRVAIPDAILCCGRPLYDFGMLDRAKRLLLKTLDTLAARDRSRNSHRGAGTELRRRLSRRADQPVSRR